MEENSHKESVSIHALCIQSYDVASAKFLKVSL